MNAARTLPKGAQGVGKTGLHAARAVCIDDRPRCAQSSPLHAGFGDRPARGVPFPEIRMSAPAGKTASGYLFIASGAAFFAAAYLGHQVAFYGLGAAFIAIGAAFLGRAKRAN